MSRGLKLRVNRQCFIGLGALVVLCSWFHGNTCAAQSNLTLNLKLDASEILVGEAVSGVLILESNDDSARRVYFEDRQVFTGVTMHVETDQDVINIRPYELIGSIGGHSTRTELFLGGNARYQDLVFLQSYWGGGGIDDIANRYSALVAAEAGEMRVWATLPIQVEGIGEVNIVSNVVVVRVRDKGEGFEDYMSKIGYLPIYKPFTRCPVKDVEGVGVFGEYRLPMEKVVAYQYGPRLKKLIFKRERDKGRTPEQTYSMIVRGMAGGDSLHANRWRRAMLYLYDDIYVTTKSRAVVDENEVSELLNQIPRRAPY